jgi:tryptophan synthase alpha chain
MNRLSELFGKKKNILSVYFTAGYPTLEDTLPLAGELGRAGVDMLEIGIPFSDPLADGPVIQQSSEKALENGMNLKLLLSQLEGLRKAEPVMPVLLMGYLNPILQYGVEAFCKRINGLGIDGLIIPDLPLQEYLDDYKAIFKHYEIVPVFLITPQTSDERIRLLDAQSESFLYLVSTAGTTGVKAGISEAQQQYFERVKGMKLRSPLMIGFGIGDASSFEQACNYAHGAIIGSAFIKELDKNWKTKGTVPSFVNKIRNN